MIVGSVKEDTSIDKRISITPDTAKNLIGLGLKVYLEKKYAEHLGIPDENYKNVKFFDNPNELIKSSNLSSLLFSSKSLIIPKAERLNAKGSFELVGF